MTNTRVLSVMLFIIVCLLFMSTISFSQPTASQLFEKALYIEEARGELLEAIDLYQQILNQYTEDRSLAAKALLHTGLCYEKLGYKEALKAYQQLVNKFPDQEQEVVIARERLSRLKRTAEEEAPKSSKPKFTKIKIPTELSWYVALSPDGKNLALVSDKKLWIMPLSGKLGADIPGIPVELNTQGVEVEWTPVSWSGDGKWIAFNEYAHKDEHGLVQDDQGIYIVSSSGGKPKKITGNYRDARTVNYRISLSPDAKQLAFSSVEANEQYIFTIPINGSTATRLTNKQAREPVFSPGGKLIAFVEDKKIGRGSGNLDLWIIPAQGGIPVHIANAGKASNPVWSPDGRMIAFLDLTRDRQIFIVPVNIKGKEISKTVSFNIPEELAEVSSLAGWTPGNKIGLLCFTREEFALYTLPLHGGQAAMILHDRYAFQPRWSPDGEKIYYTTSPIEGSDKFYRIYLASVSANGGKGKSLYVDKKQSKLRYLPFQGGNRVSPNGKMIISAAWTSADTSSEYNFPMAKIWKIAVDGSESVQLTNKPEPYTDGSPCWSPDGEEVAFVRVKLNKTGTGLEPYRDAVIYRINSTGGVPELLANESDKYINSLIWSPNGKMIAYLSTEKSAPHTNAINVFDINNHKSSVVTEVKVAHVNIEMDWSPDSKRIAFNDGKGKVIKILNLNDGSIEDVGTGLVDISIYNLDWSTDGQKFVFGGKKSGNKEFWLMEDFLPLVQR